MVEKKVIFGIGTGRCGTVSLCELLNTQKFSCFTHEMRPLLDWNGPTQAVDKRIKKILSGEEKYVGDIAFFYLPYIEHILNHYSGAKVICLKRAKNEVVQSFMKKTRRRNHWVNHNGLFWNKDEWDKCFPTYKSLWKRNAVGHYWDEYYESVDDLKLKYPTSILLMDMEQALNTKSGIQKLLCFAGIKEEHRIIRQDIKRNTI